jgi:hypothetical protein
MRESSRKFPATQQCGHRLKAPQRSFLRWCVDAAPSPVTPGQIPARAGRRVQRHIVDARGAEGMAAQQPRQGHPSSRPQSEALDRFVAIDRAGRQMTAVVTDQRRQRVAIQPNQHPTDIAGQAKRGDQDIWSRRWTRHGHCATFRSDDRGADRGSTGREQRFPDI